MPYVTYDAPSLHPTWGAMSPHFEPPHPARYQPAQRAHLELCRVFVVVFELYSADMSEERASCPQAQATRVIIGFMIWFEFEADGEAPRAPNFWCLSLVRLSHVVAC